MKRRLLINRILALLVCGIMCVSCMMPVAAAPAEAEKNAEIRIIEVKGNVTVINGSGREVPYAVDMAPDNGDYVKTQESSYLWMDLGNGSTAKMDAQSGVEFRTSGSKREILLDEGSLYFNLLEEDIIIRTATTALNVQNACGWVSAADREHTLICILSGEGTYSVTDPVDGQVRSESLNSGDLAECLVYPQEQEGDKCGAILRRFGEGDAAGFVLAELAEDPQILGQIAEASAVDLSPQAEAAQSRLQEEESGLKQKLEELNGKLEEQENNIAKDPTWEGGVKPEEEDIATAVEIPSPVPGVEPTFEEENQDPVPSASPAAHLPEPKNGSDNKPEPQQEERTAMSSEPVADSDNEPEPDWGEDVAAPSEPVTNPGSASTGPNNSLVVKGVSVNYGAVRVGKDGQAVFKDTFTNEGNSNWIENEGQITFEGNLNNEGFAYISNKAQIIAKKDIHNYDSAHIRNRGQIRVEKDVYNGRLESFDRSSIVTGTPGNQFDSRFDVVGKYVGCDAGLLMSGGTISEFEQSGERAYTELYDVSISGVIILRNGTLDIHGGSYIGGEFRIVGGDLTLSDGVRVKTDWVFKIYAETATQVTIKDAYIDAYFYGKSYGGTLSLSVEDGAVISSEDPYDNALIYLEWEEGKCSLNLNGGMIEKKYSKYGNTDPVIWLNTSDGKSYIPDCLSEIHTELKSVPREDLGGIAVAAWIGYLDENYENVGEYTTVWDGNCWRLELINPDGSKAAEASAMDEEANPPEDEELTEPETNETLEAENPEEPKDSENEENPEEPKDSEDEENPDESKDPSESEEPSEPKDPAGSEDPKKPAEGGSSDKETPPGGGDESGSGDKETPPDSGDESGSGDKETPPGGGDVLPPENAGDKKEEEPVKDKGAGKEGEAAREQSE